MYHVAPQAAALRRGKYGAGHDFTEVLLYLLMMLPARQLEMRLFLHNFAH